ncbi:hypothetical protein MCHI_000501 [Candidatus Magnetoovum chiemensis]|nr:hypothetical protein MCHI_000501 [Candidatus Magnetoovum chiemensis]
MKITAVEHFSSSELIRRLRDVTMLTNPQVYPYKEVFISLESISTDHLVPAQSYILNSELLKVRQLKWELEGHGIDMFNLNGYVKFWLDGYSEPLDLLPPVVEESVERDGLVVNIVNDGMHRVYAARLEWVIPQVVFIRGIPKELPYYAYPVRGGWDRVAAVDRLEEGFIKKWHRIKEYKTLYRNFNSAFENVGAPRGYTK